MKKKKKAKKARTYERHKCPICKNTIIGTWSFKHHLMVVHKKSRKQAGFK